MDFDCPHEANNILIYLYIKNEIQKNFSPTRHFNEIITIFHERSLVTRQAEASVGRQERRSWR
jgi:hypothetical protein